MSAGPGVPGGAGAAAGAGGQRSQAETLAVLAATTLAVWLCWIMLRPFFQSIIWAAVMAILFFPAHRWIRRRLRRPALSAAASLVLVLVTVIGPLVFVTTALVAEVADAANSLQATLQRMQADPSTALAIERARAAAGQYVDIDTLLASDKLREVATRASQLLVERSAGLIGGLLGILVSAAIAVFTLYYLFRDGEGIAERLPGMLPLEPAHAERIITRTHEMITASVYGVVVIAIVQGTLGGIIFAILGLPSPLLWGVVMTVLSTVPMAGSAIVWGPAAAFLFATGQYGKGSILIAWGVLIIGMADNLLRPRLVARKTRMHELMIFFSVLGGLGAFGVVGLLLGPVVLAIALALLEVVFGRRDGAAAAAGAGA